MYYILFQNCADVCGIKRMGLSYVALSVCVCVCVGVCVCVFYCTGSHLTE